MRRITTIDHVMEDCALLCAADARLGAIRQAAGPLPLRLVAPGFASLVSIVVSQQVSRASAEAIMGRFARLLDPLTPEAVLAAPDALFREAGLSRPKQRAVIACADAVAGGLDLDLMCAMPEREAIGRLTAIPGVGEWTAEVYLLFAAGHPDIFPARDVALQSAAGAALGIDPRPDARTLARIAESWAPWRGAAARLLWAYYRHLKGREAAPVAPVADAM